MSEQNIDGSPILCKKWSGWDESDTELYRPGRLGQLFLGVSGREGRSVQPENVDITIGKVFSPARREGESAEN
jgi:hypothetical protein